MKRQPNEQYYLMYWNGTYSTVAYYKRNRARILRATAPIAMFIATEETARARAIETFYNN